jgi:hypothetical protein
MRFLNQDEFHSSIFLVVNTCLYIWVDCFVTKLHKITSEIHSTWQNEMNNPLLTQSCQVNTNSLMMLKIVEQVILFHACLHHVISSFVSKWINHDAQQFKLFFELLICFKSIEIDEKIDRKETNIKKELVKKLNKQINPNN